MTSEPLTPRELLDLARAGNESVLDDPRCATVRDEYGMTPLHILAGRIQATKLLAHPEAGVVQDKYGWTPLHYAAEELATRSESSRQRSEIMAALTHPAVATIKTFEGTTALHILARTGSIREVLDHSETGWVKNAAGSTPLHFLASARVEEIMDHPNAYLVHNKRGETPLEVLARHGSREAQRRVADMELVGAVNEELREERHRGERSFLRESARQQFEEQQADSSPDDEREEPGP